MIADTPKILLVDDIPQNLVALEAVLQSPDYQIMTANSGEDALKQVYSEDFALILMDIQMPGLSGFETAMLIKKRERSEFIPIIFITASFVDAVSTSKGYDSGGVDFIIKPFDPDALRTKVHFFTETYRKNLKTLHQLEIEKEFHQLIQVVAHDLKNPLSSVNLSLEVVKVILSSEEIPEKNMVNMKFAAIDRSLFQMQMIINDLLDFTAIEGSSIVLNKDHVNMGEVVTQVLEILDPFMIQKEIEVETEFPADACRILCDKNRIMQVLSNLIGNAIKFSPEKSKIIIKQKCLEDSVQVEVIDSGPGISVQDIPHIFKKYWRTTQNNKKGSGLGLSIAKWIIEAHHGKIWAESGPKQGTKFTFELPKKNGH